MIAFIPQRSWGFFFLMRTGKFKITVTAMPVQIHLLHHLPLRFWMRPCGLGQTGLVNQWV